MDYCRIINVLKEQVKPALGCTEPVAVALACARARETAAGQVEEINVRVSLNIYKNGMGVNIPGSPEVGLVWAAALGALAGDSTKELEVLETITEESVLEARELIEGGRVQIVPDVNLTGVYVESTVTTQNGCCKAIITGTHTNIIEVSLNDKTIFYKENTETTATGNPQSIGDITLTQLRGIIETIPLSDIEFLLDGVTMNRAAASAGLSEERGLTLGSGLQSMMKDGVLQGDLVSKARIICAAAADARMSGLKVPVMTSGGSGNQGVGAILPVAVVVEHYNIDNEKLARALAFSHLVNIMIKEFTGKLSAACGCAIAAGIGASAAIAWLLGCDDDQISGAIKNMAGNLCGMICDGAKGSCAFKLATASGEAVIAAHLAKQNIIIPASTGIISVTAEDTIRNIGKVCAEGMAYTDKAIMEVILKNLG